MTCPPVTISRLQTSIAALIARFPYAVQLVRLRHLRRRAIGAADRDNGEAGADYLGRVVGHET